MKSIALLPLILFAGCCMLAKGQPREPIHRVPKDGGVVTVAAQTVGASSSPKTHDHLTQNANGYYYRAPCSSSRCIVPRFQVDTKALLEMMAKDSRFRPKPGPPGKDGRDGRDAAEPSAFDVDRLCDQLARDPRFARQRIDVDQLAAEVVKRLPNVIVEQYDSAGKLTSRQSRPLGEAIRFQRTKTRRAP